jgi:hypothetical protein
LAGLAVLALAPAACCNTSSVGAGQADKDALLVVANTDLMYELRRAA